MYSSYTGSYLGSGFFYT